MRIANHYGLALLLATVGAATAEVPPQAALERTITALDTAVFDAFNHCADPAQLAKHAAFFAPGVEFYHDTGGVTWSRDAMIAELRTNPKYYAKSPDELLSAAAWQAAGGAIFVGDNRADAARDTAVDAAAREAGQGSLQATKVTDPGRSIFVVGPGLAVGAER